MSHVKEGYKQTKVGVIPEDWEVVKLGDVADFYKGKGISKNDISNDGIDCIRYGQLYTNYNEKIEKIISKTNIPKEQLFLSKNNDILIPASGETAIDLATASCVLKDNIGLSGDINVIRTSLNGIFLSYYLNVVAKTRIASLAQGISVIHLYSSQLKSLYISYPPLPEQQKIANILSTWDSAISKQEELITQKEKLKKGLMQKLLSGEVRFGGFDDEWDVVQLGDYVQIQSGISPSNYKLEESGKYLFLKVEDLNNCQKYQKFSRKYLDTNQSNQNLIPINSIIFPKRGAAILLNKVRINKVKSLMDSNLMSVTPNDEVDTEYLFYKILQEKLYKIADTSTIPQINNKHIVPYKFLLPQSKEQQKIAKVLTLADKEIELLKNELEQLKTQKKGLMQKLLTGEVRVKL